MKYRKFGKLDWEVSVLGFGAMRLPQTSENMGDVDEEESIRMIRYAIDRGVNYLDSAYLYHMGKSEPIIARALEDGYREKVRIATKLPVRMVESADKFDDYLNEQMERLKTKKLDFYLLHGLNGESWPKVRDWGILDWANEKLAEGKFSYFGFSFHDDYDVFKDIIDSYDNWTMCQIQYNYMDKDYQAGRRGVEYAAEKGLAIVVMEPLRGGSLTQETPESITKIWNEAPVKRSPAEWGLMWVWNQPEITIALSGMSTMEQVVENTEIAGRAEPGLLTPEELGIIDRVSEAYRSLRPIPCTGCAYCMPCPNGVEIPQIFQIYNDAKMYNNIHMGRFRYQMTDMLKEEQRGDQCIECGQCLEACPQSIEIPDWLKKAHEELIQPQ
ncbi:MAG: aldo/keto reductase [Dehalococcoidales bacterium]|nr:aldo/keto reductase [Dehalococcoidales bacterium]